MVTGTMVASAFSLIWHWSWGHTQSNVTGMATSPMKPAGRPGCDKADRCLVGVKPASFAATGGQMVLITRLLHSRLLRAKFRFGVPGDGLKSDIPHRVASFATQFKVNDILVI
jgi:hypothetical protein